MLVKVVSLKRGLTVLIIFTLLVIAFWHFMLRHNLEQLDDTRLKNVWTWSCEKDVCMKKLQTSSSAYTPLITCQMFCGKPPIWPYPTGTVQIGRSSSRFRLSQITLQIEGDVAPGINEMLSHAFDIFFGNLRLLLRAADTKRLLTDVDEVLIIVNAEEIENEPLTTDTIEAYKMLIYYASHTIKVQLYASTFFGMRHALETLSQMIWWDGSSLCILNDVHVTDGPQFGYRGLMIDTSRNFIPIPALKMTLNAMAASKLNAFHWHLSDSHSFPFDSPRVPKMSIYGAYSQEQVYTSADVEELTKYALMRGIRIIPEIDAPAHAANGWQWGPEAGMGNLSLCINAQPWQNFCGQPPCGQLNPDNYNSYMVLGDIYRDLVELTKVTDVFHLGGDEVNYECWKRELPVGDGEFSPEDFFEKWTYFEKKALEKLRQANSGILPKYVIVWSSDLTRNYKLDAKQFVVQVWSSSRLPDTSDLVESSYNVIISHVDAWYLDCGLGDYRKIGEGPCGSLRTWQTVYQHRPWKDYSKTGQQKVLGGEACLWTERSDETVLDSRLWPRASALAERLWSDPEREVPENEIPLQDGSNDENLLNAYRRISIHRQRLLALGVKADTIHPQWCHQNPDMCF